MMTYMYASFTKDIHVTMTEIVPIWHYPNGTVLPASGANDKSSASAQTKVEEHDPSPCQSDEANSSTATSPSDDSDQGNIDSLACMIK